MVLAAPLELLLTTWYFRFTAVLLLDSAPSIRRNRRSTAVPTFNYSYTLRFWYRQRLATSFNCSEDFSSLCHPLSKSMSFDFGI